MDRENIHTVLDTSAAFGAKKRANSQSLCGNEERLV
jgi:hypothetical protein